MTTQEFYNYITQYMTPEEALMKLLQSSLISYEKLKFDKGQEAHPVFIITMAAMDMGWQFAIEPNQPNVRGMVIGTDEYMKTIFPEKEPLPT